MKHRVIGVYLRALYDDTCPILNIANQNIQITT